MKRLPFFLVLLLILLAIACPMGGQPDDSDDNDDDNGDDTQISYFSWTSPNLPEEAIFSVSELADSESRSVSRWISSDGDSGYEQILPDTFHAAYSYIGLVPETMIAQMVEVGFQAYRRGSGLIEEDTLENIDPARIPGYYDNAIPGSPPYWESGNPIFESYVGDDTTITREDVKAASFGIYDSSDHGGELKVFDVTGEDTEITLEDLPDDLSVKYSGVASELVYYQCDITGYGSIRFYFNDHDPYYAGDVLVDTGEGYKWAYLKHGDGIDADCFNYTTTNPNYVNVYSPDDPDDPRGEWSSHPYDGLIDLSDPDNANESDYNHSYTDLYTYVFDFDSDTFSGSETPNGAKRPAGTGAFSYLMVSDEIMNKGFEQDPNQFTYPHLNLNELKDIGGYALYTNDGDPRTDVAFKHRPGDLDDGNYISGYHEVNSGGQGENSQVYTPGSAFIVYHEDDYHAGEEDLTHIVYLDHRLDYVGEDKDSDTTNDVLLTRKELKKQYGWYAWDSGLYSTLYDDGEIIYKDGSTYGVKLNPLYFALGRMNVYADAPHEDPTNGPVYSDSWFDRIISMDIKLQLRADLRYATDSFGMSYGSEGSDVGSADFEKRFFSFLPTWIASPPSAPVAKPYHFQGTDDLNELPFRFVVVPQDFKIAHNYVHYSDVYTKPPDCYPFAEEGPFSENIELTMKIGSGEMDSRIFYTLDGSEPVVIGSVDNLTTLAAGNSATSRYTVPIVLPRTEEPVTVTAVGYERKTYIDNSLASKECSLPRKAIYSFTEPGSALTCQITTSSMENGTPLFAGLFAEQPVSLEGTLNPLYWGDAVIVSGAATITIEDVPDGTYYLCILADVNKDEEMSSGDRIYPSQSSSPAETHQLSASEVIVPTTSQVVITGSSWSIY